jgi:hypothetical protein
MKSIPKDTRRVQVAAAITVGVGQYSMERAKKPGVGLIGKSADQIGQNIVSPVPVTMDMVEARFGLPFHGPRLDFAERLQTDQPRPERGFASLSEMAIRTAFQTKGPDFRGWSWAWEYLPPGFVSAQSDSRG